MSIRVGTAQRWAYPTILILSGLALGLSAAPAPLYGVYAELWDFEPITITIVFAVYAVAALLSVLFTGPLSDRIGRRPVLIAAVTVLLAGLVAFGFASSVAWLLAARVLHGLGVGAIVAVGSAALLDLQPDHGARTGRRTVVAFNLGVAVTVFAVSLIAEYAPHRLVTPFVALAVVTAALLAAVVLMRESHPNARSQGIGTSVGVRLRVPASIAADFRFSAIGAAASWSVLGVFLSLLPSIALAAVDSRSLVFAGSIAAISSLGAALSQPMAARWTPRAAAVRGDAGMAVFLVVAIVAIASGSATAILVASTLVGFFFGMAFGGSLRHLADVVPFDRRGEVMSAFYVLAYGAMVVPTLLAGWAATVWSPEQIIGPFFGCVALTSVVAGVLGLRLPAPDADVRPED